MLNQEIHIRIENGGQRAVLQIPEGFPADYLDASLLEMILVGRSIVVDDDVRATVQQVVEAYDDAPGPTEVVVAEAVAPIDGEDGRFEWLDGFDPTIRQSDGSGEDPSQAMDHYNQVRYIHVTEGTHVATFRPPTKGTPGRDVRGEPIPATPGRPTFMQCDATLEVDAEGRAIARKPGVLVVEHGVLSVSRLMEVRAFADFSTGNIDYDGSVHIRLGIRDRFTVKATSDVIVDGLIEAAHVIAGRDLIVHAGMTGRESGTINVGRDAQVGYLNQVRGKVAGDLSVRRELIGCQLRVAGDLRGPNAAMIGGEVRIDGKGALGSIGSAAGIPTTVHLAAPVDDDESCSEESAVIGELVVERMIFAGVTLRFGERTYRVRENLRGPLRIWKSEEGVMCRVGSSKRRPIEEYLRGRSNAA